TGRHGASGRLIAVVDSDNDALDALDALSSSTAVRRRRLDTVRHVRGS
ncbi:hypothetical protein CCHR01_07183, partial [Colletotrichum chrysophilum]